MVVSPARRLPPPPLPVAAGRAADRLRAAYGLDAPPPPLVNLLA